MAPLRSGMCPLLTEDIITKLKSIGIKSGEYLSLTLLRCTDRPCVNAVLDFVSEPAELLSKRAELSFQDVQSIRESLLCQFSDYPLSGRPALEEERAGHEVFTTGCSSLDRLLGGGVVTGQLTELCGPPASGKTQVSREIIKRGCHCCYCTVGVSVCSGRSCHNFDCCLH